MATDKTEKIADLLFEVIDEWKTLHQASEDEVFTECNCCGGWEEHKDGCPIPVIEAWLNR